MSSELDKLFQNHVQAIADASALVIDARGCATITVIAGSGATVTVSRVDSQAAAAHTTGTENSFTVAATTRTATPVDWPWFRVSPSGGACRVACF